jgi:pimeloyl-ACP methyl ester carboxylesterase
MFGLRLIPVLPFDLLSFLFGVVDFRFKFFLGATLLGSIPETYMMASFGSPQYSLLHSTVSALGIALVCFVLPVVVFEFLSRKQGTSLWVRLKAMWRELEFEVKVNNGIVKRNPISGKKVPVLLLYGFFSSRRALTVIERQLDAKGYEVLSFNLGGLLGVFFTRGITETADFIDYKLKRQFARHNFSQVNIVAHSKGGLVALWWLLKLGGARYCNKVITMGTPYSGTNLTWLALVTPLGFMWKDMWQMRPHSTLLRELQACRIPDHVEIHCLYSHKDAVATGDSGLFKPALPSPRVFPVPMHHVSHFEFLYRRTVGDTLAKLLGTPTAIPQAPEPTELSGEGAEATDLPMAANSSH